MVVAMVISMVVMLLSAGKISGFVEKPPTVKILALSFLLLIGVMLVAESMGQHVSKGGPIEPASKNSGPIEPVLKNNV